jgi:hypothetical protein
LSDLPLACLSILEPSCLIFLVAKSHFRLTLVRGNVEADNARLGFGTVEEAASKAGWAATCERAMERLFPVLVRELEAR